MYPGWENAEYSPLVSPKWLQEYIKDNNDNLGDPKLRILDGSWHPPITKRSGSEEWKVEHIPGALHFDVGDCIHKSPGPNLIFMPPPVAEFEEYVGKLGIKNDTHVVVYDNNETFGTFSATRVWWLFRLFGHDRVSILDGGFPGWKNDANRPVTDVAPSVELQTFKAQYRQELVKSYEDVVENIKSDKNLFQLVDARLPVQFTGSTPEPNPTNGHVTGATNLLFANIIDKKTKSTKDKDALAEAFGGIQLNKPITVMCLTGILSSNLAFALHLLRAPAEVSLYEGGWMEWVHRADASKKVVDGLESA